MGCIASALGAPEINLDVEGIAATAEEAGKKIVDDIPKKEAELRKEAAKAGPAGYAVPQTKFVLIDGKSVDKDYKVAAAAIAAGKEVRDGVKDQSWEAVSGPVTEQIPAETPEMVKKKALDIARNKHDDIVDKAIDKALDKALNGGAAGAADEKKVAGAKAGDKAGDKKPAAAKKGKKDEKDGDDEDGGDDGADAADGGNGANDE